MNLLTEFNAVIRNSEEGKTKWISIIKTLNQGVNRKEPRVDNTQQAMMDKIVEEPKVDNDMFSSNSMMCPQTLCTIPRVYWHVARSIETED